MGTLIIRSLTQVCWGCPSAWEAVTDQGIPLYVRYRWGSWYVMRDDTHEVLARGEYGEEFSGVCNWSEIVAEIAKAGLHMVVACEIPDNPADTEYDSEGLRHFLESLIDRETT